MPWQIVPSRLWDWLRGEDPAKVKRVTSAVWQMEKLDLAELERAAGGAGRNRGARPARSVKLPRKQFRGPRGDGRERGEVLAVAGKP